MGSVIAIGSNIARIRRERKLTQEDIASFLGVTKASVSKWETGQSYPDIELLPRIATFFGISIDELMGYEPQMSRQELRDTCKLLRKAFAEESFDEVHEKCRELVRGYHSCWPLLIQVAALYVNHMDLADPDGRRSLVEETVLLCQRVRHGSDSSVYIRQAEALEALLLLSGGNAREAAELLAGTDAPDMGADIILARAHGALGQADRADEILQAMTYQALVLNLSRLAELAMLHAGDPRKLGMLHDRTLKLIDAFDLESSYANIAAVHFAFAEAYALGGVTDGAIACLEDYERSCRAIEFPIRLHGDELFDRIDAWLDEKNDMGTDAPRDDALVKKGLVTGVLNNPAFASLAQDPRFQRIVHDLKEMAR